MMMSFAQCGRQAETNGTFGALVRLALLTAQRQDKLASIKWSDVRDGVWTIATEDREKGNAGELVLPDAAVAIIEEQFARARSFLLPRWHRLRLWLLKDEARIRPQGEDCTLDLPRPPPHGQEPNAAGGSVAPYLRAGVGPCDCWR